MREIGKDIVVAATPLAAQKLAAAGMISEMAALLASLAALLTALLRLIEYLKKRRDGDSSVS